MSKKTNKGRRPDLPAAAFNAPAAPVAAGNTPAGAGATSGRQPTTTVRAINWQGEYGDVMNDLKRTGLIAVGLLAVLVALSFVL